MKLVASCKLSKYGVFVNSKLVSNLTKEDWKRELYSKFGKEYPKFHKMDNLSKLAFLSFSFLKEKLNIDKYMDDEITLIFANTSSSKTTDLKYIESYKYKGNPSPSLFVYTLPNILTGELSILNKWYGENAFFIKEKFDPEFYIEQINLYLSKGTKGALAGWIESNDSIEECFLFFIEKGQKKVTVEQLNKLYKI